MTFCAGGVEAALNVVCRVHTVDSVERLIGGVFCGVVLIRKVEIYAAGELDAKTCGDIALLLSYGVFSFLRLVSI